MANLQAKTNNAWWFGSTVVFEWDSDFFRFIYKKSYFCKIASRLSSFSAIMSLWHKVYLLRVRWFRLAVFVKEKQNEFVFFYTFSVQYDMCRDFHILVRDTYQAGKREVFRQSPQISGIQHTNRFDYLFYVRSIHFDGRELFCP